MLRFSERRQVCLTAAIAGEPWAALRISSQSQPPPAIEHQTLAVTKATVLKSVR